MLYTISFERSAADDGETNLWTATEQCREFISQKLRNAGSLAVPQLFDWLPPMVDYEGKRYQISACFVSVHSIDELEDIFRQAVDAGLGGRIKIKPRPAAFLRIIQGN